MTGPTTAVVSLTWADVMSMAPGPQRDRVAYEWRQRVQQRRVRRADDIEDALRTRLAAEEVLARIPREPLHVVSARRRALDDATSGWSR